MRFVTVDAIRSRHGKIKRCHNIVMVYNKVVSKSACETHGNNIHKFTYIKNTGLQLRNIFDCVATLLQTEINK